MSITEQREGIEAGRLDMFVDGAFAFTLTLLAIGGEGIPDSGAKLLLLLREIPASAMCFAQIAVMWHGHVRWRRLCTQNTRAGLLLSVTLVFFALVFVYPVHMVYASLCNALSNGVLSPEFGLHSAADARAVFTCYGLAYTCMSGTLLLLFRHAANLPGVPAERRFKARMESVSWGLPAVIGLLSALTALVLPQQSNGLIWALPGFMYALLFLTGPVMGFYRRRYAA